MKNDPIQAKLADLGTVDAATADGRNQLAKALADRSSLVVKKAARMAGEARITELLPYLRKAFDRILPKAAEIDKGCAALTAIVGALVELDYDEPEPFLAGIRHVQMEPVWGGSVDTAPDLRAACAVGLINTRHPRMLEELTTLLADREWRARVGAIRALATTGADAAFLLLRYKALIGDEERDVLFECFSALIAADESASIPLVSARMDSASDEIVEAAILALGTARHKWAFEALQRKLKQPRLGPIRRTILLAMASMRLDEAVAFVKDLAKGEDKEAEDVLHELQIT
ncbi:MAG: hypothetical protein ABI823_03515 [Bryobacteraceae bacterium]